MQALFANFRGSVLHGQDQARLVEIHGVDRQIRPGLGGIGAGAVGVDDIAVVIRRLPYTIRSSVAILQQIPLSIEEAAISLGCSKLKAFFTITVPMMTNGIMSGAIISWITIITELSTAIILYSVTTETLTLTVYTSVVQGNDGVAAAVATILLVVTTISLLLFMKFSKNKDLAF